MQENKRETVQILPPHTIGIIGGGQLGRMMSIAAKYLGYKTIVLDPTPNCPTSQVADSQIVAAYDDMDAIIELTNKCDVITYEFENVDLTAAKYIEKAGKLPQGALALEITQNRQAEKELMQDATLPVPAFAIVENGEMTQEALKTIPLPAVIKSCRGGYDGKGQLKIATKADIAAAIAYADQPGTFIVEQWISFDKEISTIFTRSQAGEIEFFPLAENKHKDHILYETIVPARISREVEIKAYKAATVLANKVNVVGTFAIEMFIAGDEIYINEMAPRPHNSGHYTIEACNVSQFTQHIRAICGLPLMEVTLLAPTRMINVLGEDMPRAMRALIDIPNSFLHLYGKEEVMAKRKMGHITFIGENSETVELLKEMYEAPLK